MTDEKIIFERFMLAMKAYKDALFMYKTLIEYGYFYDDISFEDGDFSPEIFIDCSSDFYDIDNDDATFLQEASAVKLICRLNQTYSQHNEMPSDSLYVKMAKSIINKKNTESISDLINIIKAFIENKKIDKNELDDAFVKYIVNRIQSIFCLSSN